MVVKIVNDVLVETLGSESQALDVSSNPLLVYMMVGLQGSGKTTTSAKLGKHLTQKAGKKVLMASLDTRRPAAQEQLAVLGEQTNVETLAIVLVSPQLISPNAAWMRPAVVVLIS